MASGVLYVRGFHACFALSPTRGGLAFSSKRLAAPVERLLMIGAAHQVIPAFFGNIKMTLDAGVGTFSGEIALSGPVGRVSFGGVLLPKTGVGRGQVFFPNAIGEVELGAP